MRSPCMFARADSSYTSRSTGRHSPALLFPQFRDVSGVMFSMPFVEEKQPVDIALTTFRMNQRACKLLRLERPPDPDKAIVDGGQKGQGHLDRRGLRVRQFGPGVLVVGLDRWLFFR